MVNKKYPKISIIIPIYNVEKYLDKCIESIINQTYKNLEIILVNDGSTDNCGNICDEYAKKDDRVIVIHKINGGVSSARNSGLDIATGDYISFVDSDDYVYEHTYNKNISKLLNNNVDMIMFNAICVDDHYNKINGMDWFLPVEDEIIDANIAFERLINDDVRFVVVWNKIYKKEIFNNVRFVENVGYEDEFIVHRIINECNKILCSNDGCYYYVQRKGSAIHSGFNLSNLDYGKALIDRYKFSKKYKYYNLKIHSIQKMILYMRKWETYIETDIKFKEKYEYLRRNSLYLIFEKKAWEEDGFKGGLHARFKYAFPKLTSILEKII